MYIIRYVTDKGTRHSEPVSTIESARYLRAEILNQQKPQKIEIVQLPRKDIPVEQDINPIFADDDDMLLQSSKSLTQYVCRSNNLQGLRKQE